MSGLGGVEIACEYLWIAPIGALPLFNQLLPHLPRNDLTESSTGRWTGPPSCGMGGTCCLWLVVTAWAGLPLGSPSSAYLTMKP